MEDYKKIIDNKKPEFESAVSFYKNEIGNIRTGRATSSMVEDILVDMYGSKMRIKELAAITVPEPKSIIIQPWDKKSVTAIDSAVRSSNIGVNPVVSGDQIRLNFPTLTEETRRNYIKMLKQKTEETRIKIRLIREGIWDRIQSMGKSGELREDDKFRAKEDLQKTVDGYNRAIEELEGKKEQELILF